MHYQRRRLMKTVPQTKSRNAAEPWRDSGAGIEKAIRLGRWNTARRHIRIALRSNPNDHWLITRLSTTYYEQRAYKRALGYCLQAQALAPQCPLVLWDLACALEMSGNARRARKVFRSLIRLGVDRITAGDCSEGTRWARGLIADCWYRLAKCEKTLGHLMVAASCIRRHMRLRGPHCHSIYSAVAIRAELKSIAPAACAKHRNAARKKAA
jgi:tetratricopeptide (TPR) repeat protein